MVISKTPLRISFFGGGTDYPEYYEQHGGAVLSTSIDKYVYVTVSRLNPLFDHRIRVAYSKTELTKHPAEILHPCVRNALQWLGINGGVEISVTTDLPARSGLGSSSAFTVGLLHSLYAFQGRLIDQEQLALDAIHLEQKVIGEKVGSQDQVASALGGFRHTVFAQTPLFQSRPLPLSRERADELQSHILLFFTGLTRFAEDVLDEQKKNTGANIPVLNKMKDQVLAGVDIVCDPKRSIKEFGKLLHDAWTFKQSLSSRISNPIINSAYAAAMRAGACGGKLLGAGGGGFLLIVADPGRHAHIKQSIAPLVPVEVALESNGSRLIYFQP